MSQDFLSVFPILVMLASCVVTIFIGAIACLTVYINTKQTVFASIAALSLVGVMYIFCEAFVIFTSLTGDFAFGFQMHRIQALSVVLFIPLLLFAMLQLLELNKTLKSLMKNITLVSIVFLCICSAIAFLMPKLFLDLAAPPSHVVTPWNGSRGTPGLLYRIRDIGVFVVSLYCIFMLMIEMKKTFKRSYLFTFAVGCTVAIFLGLTDLVMNIIERKSGLYTIRIFSFFGLGLTFFSLMTVFGIMQYFGEFINNTEKSRKIEALGVLAGGIAHDFNNLLTGILGSISLLSDKVADDPENASILMLTEKATQRAKNLARQLLTFAKGDASIRKTSDLRQILDETTRFILSGSAVKFTLDAPENLPQSLIDPDQIALVIQNIILNAKEALDGNGEIKINMETSQITGTHPYLKPGLYIKTVIHDNGPGIPDVVLPHIFDPYFSTKKEGSGLGLAVCYSIIKKHHGRIEARSKRNKGCAFIIHLPVIKDLLAEEKKEMVSDIRHSGKVLILDDDEIIRTVLSRMMQRLGFTVAAFSNGESALVEFTAAEKNGNPFNLLILDLTVPGGMGGADTIRELRKLGYQTPAVMISGYCDTINIAEFQKIGFQAVLPKPFSFTELKNCLGTLPGLR